MPEVHERCRGGDQRSIRHALEMNEGRTYAGSSWAHCNTYTFTKLWLWSRWDRINATYFFNDSPNSLACACVLTFHTTNLVMGGGGTASPSTFQTNNSVTFDWGTASLTTWDLLHYQVDPFPQACGLEPLDLDFSLKIKCCISGLHFESFRGTRSLELILASASTLSAFIIGSQACTRNAPEMRQRCNRDASEMHCTSTRT